MPSTTYPNFPELLKKLMDRRQFEQTGKIDRSVFEIRRNAAKLRGGFDWDITPEGKNWIRRMVARSWQKINFRGTKQTQLHIEINQYLQLSIITNLKGFLNVQLFGDANIK